MLAFNFVTNFYLYICRYVCAEKCPCLHWDIIFTLLFMSSHAQFSALKSRCLQGPPVGLSHRSDCAPVALSIFVIWAIVAGAGSLWCGELFGVCGAELYPLFIIIYLCLCFYSVLMYSRTIAHTSKCYLLNCTRL